MMQAESGKVRADAALESFYCIDAINFWLREGPRYLADEVVTPRRRTPCCGPSAARSSTPRSA